ncbi:ABC transporter permease [Limnochorda pilosa]|uniref:ABC transporter permease n=1 Tax=Limnochorda pilosa TaxID=1555112 RepID=A0A0K2SM69_LIMPI|nr:ABC transporter permease [Limnochorda pilosa]BAS27929.1 ABC transporter permease [Limnochorda pilosa]
MNRLHPLASAAALLTLAFLYGPMLAVAVFSVNASRYGLVWRGFSWDWYRKLLHDEYILQAAGNTLVLALFSTLAATLLGTALAIGMDRFPWSRRWGSLFETILYLPVVTPDIILAAALVVAFGLLRAVSSVFEPGLLTMIIGHITFQVAFVALVVRGRLVSLEKNIEEAARDLYAGTPYLLRRVMLPLLAPGIVAGSMLAFTLSLDDFVISFFTSAPTSTTLPLFIYASTRRGIMPEIHALSTLVFFATVILVVGVERLTRR